MSSRSENLIVAEVVIGIGLSIPFLIITFNLDNYFWGDDYLAGFLWFYGGLSAIFFVSVLSVGIIAAIKSKQSKQIFRDILSAIGFWLLSLVVTAVSPEMLRLFSAYFMLAGITYGFNNGLRTKTINETEKSES